MHQQTVYTACLMSEVSLGHRDPRGTHRVCLHATLSGGHLGGFTHHTPAWRSLASHKLHRPTEGGYNHPLQGPGVPPQALAPLSPPHPPEATARLPRLHHTSGRQILVHMYIYVINQVGQY